ncbi:WbqC family protein [Gammaproteobacteria bacterium]|nr:WbqC family protein [Gammaproteobacteria bacterium]
MIVAIMQPYFLPYIGYFNLISSADILVVYDEIQYTKKGWINRNRFLRNNSDAIFSIALDKASDYSLVCHRRISNAFDRRKLISQFEGAYRKAPYYSEAISLVESIVLHEENSLFEYVFNSINVLCKAYKLDTRIIRSSSLESDSRITGEERVIDICKALGATRYVNPPGGRELYDQKNFSRENIELKFLSPEIVEYPQLGSNFIPNLSIVDVMMFNGVVGSANKIKTEYKVL